MAVAVPLITAAMSSGSLLAGAAAAVGAISTIRAGRAQAAEYKTQARAEEFNAKNREIDRKRNLIRSLATQNVRQGASGISGGVGSSSQAIQLEDIGAANLDQTVDTGVTSSRVSQLQANASTAKTSSLLSAASGAAASYSRYKKRGEL